VPRVSSTTGPTLKLDSPSVVPLKKTGKTSLEVPIPSGAKGLGTVTTPSVGRGGSAKKVALGAGEDGVALSISATGRILVGGKLPSDSPGMAGDVKARVAAANLATLQGGVFPKMDAVTETKVRERLLEGLDFASKLKGVTRRELESSTTALLIDLASASPSGKRFAANATAIMDTIAKLPDREMAAFYLYSARTVLGPRLTASSKVEIAEQKAKLMPSGPPLEAWTENRTKPLVVRHTIHPEFWKEELAFFGKKNGFTLVSKNAKDTERSYTGVLKDPAGKKPDLKVELKVRKDELDYLEPMSDPKVHVVLYSGHSALGGNGQQAIDVAAAMKGPHPKLVMAANCRGKDNYASFTNKYPEAHVIMTDMPTYSISGQARIEALFSVLASGDDYAKMRKLSEKAAWDEPANNYFYPDEWRKFGFMDADSDGKVDGKEEVLDRYFDPGTRASADKFVRALNFTNTELFYHWEVEAENGSKSFFGKKYGDALLADGAIRGSEPLPGDRLMEVTPVKGKVGDKSVERWRVRFDPSKAKGVDENIYAARTMMQTALALTSLAKAPMNREAALRAVLMGAQGIHYMDVYEDTTRRARRPSSSRSAWGRSSRRTSTTSSRSSTPTPASRRSRRSMR